MNFEIELYKSGKEYSKKTFFVKCKGHSAGEPMKTPLENCFAITTNKNVFDSSYFFYLIQHYFDNGIFKKHLKGSVIPYLTKKDFIEALNSSL
tara:strand:- start:905 stop:1183 length:279 start_codon:yes stop_codon:yes gene_type:complete